MNDRFIVVTEYGNVLVSVNPSAANGLDDQLLLFSTVSSEDRASAAFETPLRAFAAKMVDIINGVGFEGTAVSGAMRDLLIREKATSELGRIERWARLNLAD